MSMIGTLNEQPLHAALKTWLAEPGDQFEVPLDGFVIDIVRPCPAGDLLIEIQTANFTALKRKLPQLLPDHRVRVVYPLPREKWIVKIDDAGEILGRRKSPRRGSVYDVFRELVHLPHLLNHPNLTLDVLLIQMNELRRFDGKRGWRRKGWIVDHRRLIDVVEQREFASAAAWGALLPADLPTPFSTSDLARAIERPRRLAQQMAYTLREIGAINAVDKRGNAILYARA